MLWQHPNQWCLVSKYKTPAESTEMKHVFIIQKTVQHEVNLFLKFQHQKEIKHNIPDCLILAPPLTINGHCFDAPDREYDWRRFTRCQTAAFYFACWIRQKRFIETTTRQKTDAKYLSETTLASLLFKSRCYQLNLGTQFVLNEIWWY